jgi:hypothetical protein
MYKKHRSSSAIIYQIFYASFLSCLLRSLDRNKCLISTMFQEEAGKDVSNENNGSAFGDAEKI